MTMTRITLTTSAVFGKEDTAALSEYLSDTLRAFTRTALGDAVKHSIAAETKQLERRFTIQYDHDAPNPCEDDDYCAFVFMFKHRRYTGGHKNAPSPWVNDDPSSGEFVPGVIECLTVYGYDHGGLTISTSPFNCPWDSGIIGAIYATKESLERAGVQYDRPDELRNDMVKFIEHYDQYMQGHCYIVTEYDELGNEIETYTGFIGDDIETNGILCEFPESEHAALRAAFNKL